MSFGSNAEYQMPFVRYIRWFAGGTPSSLNNPQLIDPGVINRFRVSVSPAVAGNLPATLVDLDSGMPVPNSGAWNGAAIPVGTSGSIKEVTIPAGTLPAGHSFILRVSGNVNAVVEVELNT